MIKHGSIVNSNSHGLTCISIGSSVEPIGVSCRSKFGTCSALSGVEVGAQGFTSNNSYGTSHVIPSNKVFPLGFLNNTSIGYCGVVYGTQYLQMDGLRSSISIGTATAGTSAQVLEPKGLKNCGIVRKPTVRGGVGVGGSAYSSSLSSSITN